MAERNGSNRTQGGLELEAKHQKTYEDWWLGKLIETPYLKDGEKIIETNYVNRNFIRKMPLLWV